MSALLPMSTQAKSASSARAASRPGWLREPLLHFIALGALLFALDYLIAGRGDDMRTIYVDAAVDSEARRVFKDARSREPDASIRARNQHILPDHRHAGNLQQLVQRAGYESRVRLYLRATSHASPANITLIALIPPVASGAATQLLPLRRCSRGLSSLLVPASGGIDSLVAGKMSCPTCRRSRH